MLFTTFIIGFHPRSKLRGIQPLKIKKTGGSRETRRSGVYMSAWPWRTHQGSGKNWRGAMNPERGTAFFLSRESWRRLATAKADKARRREEVARRWKVSKGIPCSPPFSWFGGSGIIVPPSRRQIVNPSIDSGLTLNRVEESNGWSCWHYKAYLPIHFRGMRRTAGPSAAAK